MFGAIAGGIASALAGGAMSKLFGGGQKAASGGIQGDVLATDNNTVGMENAGIKSAIQGSNVPNPDEADPSVGAGAMAKAGKGLLEGTLQAGTSAGSDKLLDWVGLGGKSAADKGKDFFFSSRSRHPRFDCDWSSDVCSSDLIRGSWVECTHRSRSPPPRRRTLSSFRGRRWCSRRMDPPSSWCKTERLRRTRSSSGSAMKIGRASCRERV